MTCSKEIFEKLYTSYPVLINCKSDIENAFSVLLTCAKENAYIYTCGNGGSAADSEHIVGELMKGFNLKRPLSVSEKVSFSSIEDGDYIASKLQKGIRSISLVSQSGLISAFANDVDPSLVFAQQVYAYAKDENDVLIALSTSGNSLNIVNAVKCANVCKIKSIAVTGENDSKLSQLATVTIKLPSTLTYEIQELTLPVYHALCSAIECELFTE